MRTKRSGRIKEEGYASLNYIPFGGWPEGVNPDYGMIMAEDGTNIPQMFIIGTDILKGLPKATFSTRTRNG
jgi:hypothetical protein